MTLWTREAGFSNRAGTSEELIFDDEAEGRLEKSMEWLLRYVFKDWSPLTLHTTTLPASLWTAVKKTSKPGRRAKATNEADLDHRFICLHLPSV
jgi:hypothetical protein